MIRESIILIVGFALITLTSLCQAWPWEDSADKIIKTKECRLGGDGLVAKNLDGKLILNGVYVHSTITKVDNNLVEFKLARGGLTYIFEVHESSKSLYILRPGGDVVLRCFK